MRIYNGNISDTTDNISKKYIKVNSCGAHNSTEGFTTIRQVGRKDHHILLITSGKCTLTHNETEYAMTPGDIAFYAPGEPQKYVFGENSSYFWCHFSGRMAEELLRDCALSGGIYRASPSRALNEAFSALIRSFDRPGGEGQENIALLRLICLVSEMLREKKSPQSSAIELAVSHINENYDKELSLEELARISGYSKSRFSHAFCEEIGIPPMKYRNEIRLRAAYELLSGSGMSVSEAAYRCGYSDPLYFSRLFRKKFGFSPSALKRTV